MDFFSDFYIFRWRVLWVCQEGLLFAEHIHSYKEMV